MRMRDDIFDNASVGAEGDKLSRNAAFTIVDALKLILGHWCYIPVHGFVMYIVYGCIWVIPRQITQGPK